MQRRTTYGIVILLISSVFAYSLYYYPRLFPLDPKTFRGIAGFKAIGFFEGTFIAAICIAAAAVLAAIGRKDRGMAKTAVKPEILIGIAVLCVLLSLVTASYILEAFANSGDEFVYLFQAKIFMSGRLFATPPPLYDVFSTNYLIEREGRWLGQYPPGWPLLLASWGKAGLPFWAVNPTLGAISAVMLYRLAMLTMVRRDALLAVAIYVGSLFFLFESASLFSHQSFVLFALVFAYCLERYERDRRVSALLLAGAAISIAFSIRYFPAVLLAGTATLFILRRTDRIRVLLGIAVGALPVFILVLSYHYAVFDNPLTTGYSWRPDASQIFRFEPLQAVRTVADQFWELALWTSPLIALLYCVAVIKKARDKTFSFVDAFLPALAIGLLAFPDPGGNRYGPRYLYDAFPFMVMTISTGWLALLNDDSSGVWTRRMHAALLVTGLYTVCSWPFAAYYYHAVVEERQDVYRLAKQTGLKNAVVLVQDPTGYRLPMYATDLARNDPDLSASVLYAHRTTPAALQNVLPGRTVWIYTKIPVKNPGG